MQGWAGRMWRGLGGTAALLVLTHCGGGVEQQPPAQEAQAPDCTTAVLEERTLEWGPEADTYVEALQTQPRGASRKLVADQASERSAYLRFTLARLPGPVQRAELRLYAIDPSVDGPALHPVESGWREEDVTWGQAPAPTGPQAADVGPVQDESWVTYDVTALVRAEGTYGFGLFAPTRDGVDFASREYPDEALRPRLAVTVLAPPEGCEGLAPAP